VVEAAPTRVRRTHNNGGFTREGAAACARPRNGPIAADIGEGIAPDSSGAIGFGRLWTGRSQSGTEWGWTAKPRHFRFMRACAQQPRARLRWRPAPPRPTPSATSIHATGA